MSNSIVKQLSIYRQSCFVKREGSIKLQKGKQNIILDTLPNTIDKTTLTVSLQEGVSGSNVQVELLDKDKQEEITKDVQSKITKIENKINIKNNQIELWNKNSDFSNHNSFDISQMSSFIENLPNKLETIYEEIEVLNKEKAELLKQLTEKQKLANAYQIRIDIEANQDQECIYEIKYKDDNAYWYPRYEIHTNDDDQLSILMKAGIVQNTDEDLRDIKIRLLSGNPSLSSDIPVLYPKKLDFFEPRVFMNMAGAAKASMMQMDTAMEVLDEEVSMSKVANVVAQTKMDDTMMEYELDGTWNIDSNKELNALLQEIKVPCKYHVIAIPKIDDNAYLAAEVNINDIENILNTNATVYHKGSYVGDIYLNPDYNQEKYDISLGKDESIKVKRTQKKKYTSNVLLKNQKKTEFEYEISVNSSKNDKCLVTLIDQVPLSQDKSIVVDIDNVSNASLDQDTGKLTWDFELDPKQNKVFNIAYSISWPKDKQINI